MGVGQNVLLSSGAVVVILGFLLYTPLHPDTDEPFKIRCIFAIFKMGKYLVNYLYIIIIITSITPSTLRSVHSEHLRKRLCLCYILWVRSILNFLPIVGENVCLVANKRVPCGCLANNVNVLANAQCERVLSVCIVVMLVISIKYSHNVGNKYEPF